MNPARWRHISAQTVQPSMGSIITDPHCAAECVFSNACRDPHPFSGGVYHLSVPDWTPDTMIAVRLNPLVVELCRLRARRPSWSDSNTMNAKA
jgi:hypothetical protein